MSQSVGKTGYTSNPNTVPINAPSSSGKTFDFSKPFDRSAITKKAGDEPIPSSYKGPTIPLSSSSPSSSPSGGGSPSGGSGGSTYSAPISSGGSSRPSSQAPTQTQKENLIQQIQSNPNLSPDQKQTFTNLIQNANSQQALDNIAKALNLAQEANVKDTLARQIQQSEALTEAQKQAFTQAVYSAKPEALSNLVSAINTAQTANVKDNVARQIDQTNLSQAQKDVFKQQVYKADSPEALQKVVTAVNVAQEARQADMSRQPATPSANPFSQFVTGFTEALPFGNVIHERMGLGTQYRDLPFDINFNRGIQVEWKGEEFAREYSDPFRIAGRVAGEALMGFGLGAVIGKGASILGKIGKSGSTVSKAEAMPMPKAQVQAGKSGTIRYIEHEIAKDVAVPSYIKPIKSVEVKPYYLRDEFDVVSKPIELKPITGKAMQDEALKPAVKVEGKPYYTKGEYDVKGKVELSEAKSKPYYERGEFDTIGKTNTDTMKEIKDVGKEMGKEGRESRIKSDTSKPSEIRSEEKEIKTKGGSLILKQEQKQIQKAETKEVIKSQTVKEIEKELQKDRAVPLEELAKRAKIKEKAPAITPMLILKKADAQEARPVLIISKKRYIEKPQAVDIAINRLEPLRKPLPTLKREDRPLETPIPARPRPKDREREKGREKEEESQPLRPVQSEPSGTSEPEPTIENILEPIKEPKDEQLEVDITEIDRVIQTPVTTSTTEELLEKPKMKKPYYQRSVLDDMFKPRKRKGMYGTSLSELLF